MTRAFIFLIIGVSISFIAEAITINYGYIFGLNYVWKENLTKVLNVPILVPFLWSVIIYLVYNITSSFLKINNFRSLLLAISTDGAIAVVLDLFIDPLGIALGYWKWIGGGFYFGIPLSNFLEWFMLTITVTGIFRIYEYKNKKS